MSPVIAIVPDLRHELSEVVDTMCRALSDPKRLAILYALLERPHTVAELAQMIGASQSNTSQHLAVLRDRGLVSPDRHASHVVYSLRHPKIIEAIDLLRQVMTDEVSRRQALRSPVPATPATPAWDVAHVESEEGAKPCLSTC